MGSLAMDCTIIVCLVLAVQAANGNIIKGVLSIDSYDNSESNTTTTYHWRYFVGTTWSQGMTQGLKVSQPVMYELLTAFFDLFKVMFFFDYNWSDVPEDVLNELSMVEGDVDIEPWDKFELEQIQGICGSSTVQTDMVRHSFSGEMALSCSQMYAFLPLIVYLLQHLQGLVQ